MIRRWYPKGTDFSQVSTRKIAELEKWMNNYPRKSLGWLCPADIA
jgi:IS30 family transposase